LDSVLWEVKQMDCNEVLAMATVLAVLVLDGKVHAAHHDRKHSCTYSVQSSSFKHDEIPAGFLLRKYSIIRLVVKNRIESDSYRTDQGILVVDI